MNGIRLWTVGSTLLIGIAVGVAYGDEAAVESLLTRLIEPRGVAVRREGTADKHEVFVADTGAGRIVKVRSDQATTSTDVITGFSEGADPVALHFLDHANLFVGCAGPPAALLFEISDQAEPQLADQAKQKGNSSAAPGVIAVARTRANEHVSDALIAVGISQQQPGWLGRIPIRAGTLGNPAALKMVDVQSPSAVAVSSQGFVLVGSKAESDESPSRLTFINPIDYVAVMQLPLSLRDITGLAYSPKTGNLYAIAAASGSDEQGGLFRIDSVIESGKPACNAIRIAAIERPTALAFGPDGVLYITGSRESQIDDQKSGALMRVKAEL